MSHFQYITNGGKCQEGKTEIEELLSCGTLDAFAAHLQYKRSYEALILPTLSDRQQAAWRDCASEIWLRPEGTVASTHSCHNRFCAVCSWRSARRRYSYTIRAMEQLKPLGYQYLFLTLTVRNVKGNALNGAISDIMHAVNRLQSTKTWRNRVLGYIRSLEVTYNADQDNYHPHLHYILCVPPDYYTTPSLYMQTGEWRELWERSARLDYAAQVDLRPIKGDTIEGAVCEVSKYALKLSSVVELGLFEPVEVIASAVKGRRLCAYGGIFRELNSALRSADKLATELERSVEGYAFEWCEGEGYRPKSLSLMRHEKPLSKALLDYAYSLRDLYKSKPVDAIEQEAIALVDSIPSADTVRGLVKQARTSAVVTALRAKKSIQKGKSKLKGGDSREGSS